MIAAEHGFLPLLGLKMEEGDREPRDCEWSQDCPKTQRNGSFARALGKEGSAADIFVEAGEIYIWTSGLQSSELSLYFFTAPGENESTY